VVYAVKQPSWPVAHITPYVKHVDLVNLVPVHACGVRHVVLSMDHTHIKPSEVIPTPSAVSAAPVLSEQPVYPIAQI
jgi:hypothetical protein